MRVATVAFPSGRVLRSASPLLLAATLYLPEGSARESAPTTPAAARPASRRFPGLVVAHGAGSCRARHDTFCREACAHGFAVLAVDLRGHGESGGKADGPLERDILAAAAFLSGHPEVDPDRLCYRGSSMGGFYGLKAAADPGSPFAALALLCPASQQVMLDALDDTHGTEQSEASARWDVPGLRTYFQAQDSLELAARIRRPVLLVHARGDAVVPFEHSLTIARYLAGDTTLVALAGGSHTSAQHDPSIHRLTAAWLMDQVTNACTERT